MTTIQIPAELIGLIQLGVAAIACYFMWDISRQMIAQVAIAITQNTTALSDLKAVIAKLCEQNNQ